MKNMKKLMKIFSLIFVILGLSNKALLKAELHGFQQGFVQQQKAIAEVAALQSQLKNDTVSKDDFDDYLANLESKTKKGFSHILTTWYEQHQNDPVPSNPIFTEKLDLLLQHVKIMQAAQELQKKLLESDENFLMHLNAISDDTLGDILSAWLTYYYTSISSHDKCILLATFFLKAQDIGTTFPEGTLPTAETIVSGIFASIKQEEWNQLKAMLQEQYYEKAIDSIKPLYKELPFTFYLSKLDKQHKQQFLEEIASNIQGDVTPEEAISAEILSQVIQFVCANQKMFLDTPELQKSLVTLLTTYITSLESAGKIATKDKKHITEVLTTLILLQTSNIISASGHDTTEKTSPPQAAQESGLKGFALALVDQQIKGQQKPTALTEEQQIALGCEIAKSAINYLTIQIKLLISHSDLLKDQDIHIAINRQLLQLFKSLMALQQYTETMHQSEIILQKGKISLLELYHSLNLIQLLQAQFHLYPTQKLILILLPKAEIDLIELYTETGAILHAVLGTTTYQSLTSSQSEEEGLSEASSEAQKIESNPALKLLESIFAKFMCIFTQKDLQLIPYKEEKDAVLAKELMAGGMQRLYNEMWTDVSTNDTYHILLNNALATALSDMIILDNLYNIGDIIKKQNPRVLEPNLALLLNLKPQNMKKTLFQETTMRKVKRSLSTLARAIK